MEKQKIKLYLPKIILLIVAVYIGFALGKYFTSPCKISTNNEFSQIKSSDVLSLIEANPSVENYILLGLAYYSEKNLEKAVEVTQQAILLNPNNAVAYNNLGAYYNELGEYDKAIESLNKALAIDSNFQRAFNNLEISKNLLNPSE